MHGSKLNQEAANSYSHSYSTKIAEDFFSKNDGISGQQIISLTPVKQVNFFVLKVLFDEWQDEIKKFKSPYFDYKNQDVNQALKTLINTLSKNIQIGKDDLIPLLEKAVLATIELLYDPVKYYSQELNRNKTSDKVRELKGASKYIKLHKPIFDNLLSSLDQTKDFSKSIQEVVSDYVAPTQELEQIVELFNQTLPMNVVEKVEVTQEISLPEPTKVVNEELEIQELEPADDINDEFEPVKEDEVINADNINQQYKEDIKTLNQRYEEEEKKETVAAVHESQSLSNLKNNININQRYMFVNDLFEGNDKDYEVAMDEVENCDSFDSSVELLVQKYAKKYAWDMNEEEVKELLKVIFKRFR